jgi:23S rRNA pseudouridine2605 synthase
MSPRRHAKQPRQSLDDEPRGLDRLQKVLAAAGIGSRRECEELITAGRVEVDGEFVTEMGRKVDPTAQKIQVDGVALTQPKRVYFALNKPVGVVSTNSDPDGRPRVIDLIKSHERLYPVGRLDRTSEGLILVTNDGDLANQLTHPRYGVEKKYHVQVVGVPAAAELRRLEEGVYIAEGLARATKAKFLKRAPNGCWLEITLAEGRNREIRRMLAGIGHKVRTLKRVSIGPLKLGDLPRGAHRPLTPMEIKLLKKAPSETPRTRRRRPTKTKSAGTAAPSNSKTAYKKTNSSDDAPSRKGRTSGKKSTPRRAKAAGVRGAAKNAKKSSRKTSVSKKPRRGGTNPKKRGSKR